MLADNPIPLFDFSLGQSPAEIVKAIHEAVTTVGFLHVKVEGLGISREDVAEMFRIHKRLFDAPQEEKDACPHIPALSRNGYKYLGHDRLSEGGGADSKESWIFGHYTPPETETTQPIPKSIQGDKATLQAFHDKCHAALCQILDYFSLAMNLPKEFFRDAHTAATNSISLLNYPALTAEQAEAVNGRGSTRAGAHKDWGSITLLFQEDTGTPGLEVFLPDEVEPVAPVTSDKPYKLITETDLSRGKWYPAPIIPGTVLVNVGLALETWTGGLYKATLHRVIVPPVTPEGVPGRRSIAFFTQPRHETKFNRISPEGKIIDTPGALTSKEFFVERMRAAMVKA